MKAELAIRKIVEANLPERRVMLERRIDTGYRKTAGPHVAWKWVSAAGLKVLLVQAPVGRDWGKIVVTAFEIYPGLTKSQSLLYRDETTNAADLPILVKQAASYL